MDSNNAHAVAMAALASQTLVPPGLDGKPMVHHRQNPVVIPPSQPPIAHAPPVPEAVMSPMGIQHQPYDPHYLHQQQNYGYKDMHINTLFVSGLPDDVKPREIHNLFRRRHGFDFCQLKYTGRGNQVVAFATFVNHQSAMTALHALNGVTFDPQSGATLHIELARSNSRRKHPPGSGAYVIIDKRLKTESDAQETWSNDGNMIL
uniref:RRM domain-containing protein n=1 Tax=Nelumbo nucifera TaxID=4432 RepID=A0A822ZE41_NELNU|nr:TPA_asm: hypothetical protein HUJ06_002684 [Nelumbo nucifera]